MNYLEMLIIALILDAVMGEPRWIWDRVPHPAILMGRAVDVLDRALNRGAVRQIKGLVAMVLLVAIALAIALAIRAIPDYGIVATIVAAILLAHNSLLAHVNAVRKGLEHSLDDGRHAVSMIVGRDTAQLDESGVSRAAIESAAENFSDGVIAPAFWFLLFGLPGLLIYKIVNTADSMIGHRNDRYTLFGWAAARLDDVLNWAPARITAGLIALVGRKRGIWEIVREDAQFHRSPNAGWPEAAMAGSLGIALAGPRSYDGIVTHDAFMNGSGRKNLTRDDIKHATRLLWRGWIILVLLLGLLQSIIMIA